ncbi:MAG: M24 family metallopeptidase [Rhizobacter sp.]|nr:M24 family metallopeptidase [Bacteriovorax sp.]
MSISPHEFTGEQFNLEDYLRAQEKTRQLVLEFSKKLHPGMTEAEAKVLLEKSLDDSGLEKKWHPTKMRMGPNTKCSFRDTSVEYTLTDNDIFFVDIGPVYYNHEGDYGESFVVGNNPRLKHLADASKKIFYATQDVWREKNLTGKELYEFATNEAEKLNLRLNTNMYGHRVGDFPHAVHTQAKLGGLPFKPSPNLWILEIHVIDDELNRGAFFEDVLA